MRTTIGAENALPGEERCTLMREALSHLETQEYEEDTAIERLRRGYLFKERLLRPAQVVVASHPTTSEDESAI